jgi:hypothetical protein
MRFVLLILCNECHSFGWIHASIIWMVINFLCLFFSQLINFVWMSARAIVLLHKCVGNRKDITKLLNKQKINICHSHKRCDSRIFSFICWYAQILIIETKLFIHLEKNQMNNQFFIINFFNLLVFKVKNKF